MEEKDKKLIKTIIKKDLGAFIQKTFHTINPSSEYFGNWHINLIAEYLKEVEKGNIKRLIINMPPRSLKSMCISIAWPAWLLGQNPATKIMVASYSQILSTKLSLDTRFVMSSKWYAEYFKQTKLHKKHNQKTKFLTTKYGFRFATSVGGSATGEGGDILIIDDPHNPSHINSEKKREKVIKWYLETFSTRLNNREEGKIVIVMQRLHDEDLVGFLTKNNKDEWTVLKIPTLATSDIDYQIGEFKHKMNIGDSIHKKLFSNENIGKLINEIGASNFESQYQQNPSKKTSGILNEDYLNFYNGLPSKFSSIILSWDTAIKTTDECDYSVCTIWGIIDDTYYLIACIQEKYEYPQLKNKAKHLAEQYKPTKILIEDKASGQSLIQDLKFEGIKNIVPCKPVHDKITRFATCIDLFEAGRVFLPRHGYTSELVKKELLNFPNVKNDDITDSVSQFLNYIKNRSSLDGLPRIRSLA